MDAFYPNIYSHMTRELISTWTDVSSYPFSTYQQEKWINFCLNKSTLVWLLQSATRNSFWIVQFRLGNTIEAFHAGTVPCTWWRLLNRIVLAGVAGNLIPLANWYLGTDFPSRTTRNTRNIITSVSICLVIQSQK